MQFIDLLRGQQILAGAGDYAIPVSGIAYDSRQVEPGFLFVAVEGFSTDGHQFVADAAAKGAAALVVQKRLPVPGEIPWVRIPDTRRGLAMMAARFYDFPSEKIQVIGVTGTNGKTTTTHLIRAVFEEQGKKTGLVGTIYNQIGEHLLPVKHTTPESVDLQGLLARMVEGNVQTAVLEVSSHALALHRVLGCRFEMAVFTNITQDHLDFHQDMDNYLAAKMKLFAGAELSIINADALHASQIIAGSGGKVITYGINKQADIMARDIEIGPRGVSYSVIAPKGAMRVNLQLTGFFNVYNSLAALAAGIGAGFKLADIKKALEKLPGVPGRFELVDQGQQFAVIVDYAHTPDGLKNILATAREFTPGRLITVFGCGGDRDRTKRPLMGEIGVTMSDWAVITSDNPRTEDPGLIIEDILMGVKKLDQAAYIVIPDRRQAIARAIKSARPGDMVVIAGKGHETYQEINGERFHFDDREEAGMVLKELGGAGS